MEVPGFNLPRRTWSILNRIRTGHDRCNSVLFKWNSVDSPNCECGEVEETIDHLINTCPIYKFQDGLRAIHMVSDSFLKWVINFKSIWWNLSYDYLHYCFCLCLYSFQIGVLSGVLEKTLTVRELQDAFQYYNIFVYTGRQGFFCWGFSLNSCIIRRTVWYPVAPTQLTSLFVLLCLIMYLLLIKRIYIYTAP